MEYKQINPWKIYPDPAADAIMPRWWHKLLFWKKWKYQEWKMNRKFITLEELLSDELVLGDDRLVFGSEHSHLP